MLYYSKRIKKEILTFLKYSNLFILPSKKLARRLDLVFLIILCIISVDLNKIIILLLLCEYKLPFLINSLMLFKAIQMNCAI